jgi:hypothetical protein
MPRSLVERHESAGLQDAARRHYAVAPWHFFHFFPLPQLQGSFRPGVFVARCGSFFGKSELIA